MSLKSRARKIQKLTGSKYLACLTELRNKGPLVLALCKLHGMKLFEADVEICFENEEDLKQRWGQELFDLAKEITCDSPSS